MRYNKAKPGSEITLVTAEWKKSRLVARALFF
jgi:hypothetical protein